MADIYQSTLVMLKPEVLERSLVGRIIQKFEDAGLNLEAMKVVLADTKHLEKHYIENDKWFMNVGNKAVLEFKKWDMNISKYLGTSKPIKIGCQIYKWHIENLNGKKVVVGILSGPHAIERVKQIVGSTEPLKSARGTIRGDWCTDSVIYSNTQHRSIANLVHRSTDQKEFLRESKVWFN